MRCIIGCSAIHGWWPSCLNTKFHADTGERREGDMIWRIPRGDCEDTYLILLLEFQSTSGSPPAVISRER
jgi:hypothetical protein